MHLHWQVHYRCQIIKSVFSLIDVTAENIVEHFISKTKSCGYKLVRTEETHAALMELRIHQDAAVL